jgi:hypothetical protein
VSTTTVPIGSLLKYLTTWRCHFLSILAKLVFWNVTPLSTAVPAKLEDAAANAGFWTAPAPSNANPPSTIFLRVHGIGNIPLKAKQRSVSKSDFSFATTEKSYPP